MKCIGILGSTGSIGRQTVEVCRFLDYPVAFLTAKTSADLLFEQAKVLKPQVLVLEDESKAELLREKVKAAGLACRVEAGRRALIEVAKLPGVDMVLSSMVGMAGLEPTLAALESGIDVALANKETLVVGGDLVVKTARDHGAKLYPVDSEHSAIWQALAGGKKDALYKIFLTCSGGPFRGKKREDLAHVTAEEALNHPTWKMGGKITIDSATLMNKAFELIEACYLFDVDDRAVEVVVHPESIIHSMVEFNDHSVLAQLGVTDMRLPIQYALTYPERMDSLTPAFAPFSPKAHRLSFEPVDEETFPSIAWARQAWQKGQGTSIILNAANEVAVEYFLSGKISFVAIWEIIRHCLAKITAPKGFNLYNLEDILALDLETRREAGLRADRL